MSRVCFYTPNYLVLVCGCRTATRKAATVHDHCIASFYFSLYSYTIAIKRIDRKMRARQDIYFWANPQKRQSFRTDTANGSEEEHAPTITRISTRCMHPVRPLRNNPIQSHTFKTGLELKSPCACHVAPVLIATVVGWA